jgi:adenosyl cobinamide kinase/adenosyl cobinamide phosphate guanylyltransferase
VSVSALVLGGVSSGKSAFAESLLPATEPVTYYATLDPSAEGVSERIDRHRARRPAQWVTVECGVDLPARLAEGTGAALIDSLGTWVSCFSQAKADVGALTTALGSYLGPVIVVGEEVGLSLLPPTAIGIAFQEAMGRLNQEIAAIADRVFLVVAGRALVL